MSDLSAKFTALEEQLASQATTINGYVDTVEAKLQAIFDELDTVIVNNAANTKALLQALGANSPCATCPTPSLTVPVTDPTTRAVNFDKCKRTQAFLHAMAEIMTVLDTMSAFSIPFSPSLISDAISQVITALENGDTTPLPSFPESVQLVGDGINYIAGNFTVGGTLSSYFSSVLLDLRDAIFPAPNAASDQEAYKTVINASGLPSYVKPLINDAAYNELWSYYFDPASMPNLTGYDGFVCSGTDCFEGTSHTSVTTGSSGPLSVMILGEPFTTTDFGGFSTWSENAVCTDPLNGWTVQTTVATHVYEGCGSGTHADILPDTPFTLTTPTCLVVYSDVNVAFDWTLCPPA